MITSEPGLRVAAIIHYSRNNYGNHLVNYAIRHVLERRGYEVDLLVPEGEAEERRIARKLIRLPRKLRRLGIRGVLDRLARRIRPLRDATATSRVGTEVSARRIAHFDAFSKEMLRVRFFPRSSRRLLTEAYSWFVIGSDQIWNYDYDLDGTMFADFAPRGTAITMSPSVGHDSIPEEWLTTYVRLLSSFDEVGVREDEWASAMKPMSSLPEVTQLIDPTLLVDVEHWLKIARSRSHQRKYLLVYHLGELGADAEEYIAAAAIYYQLDILRLSPYVGGDIWATDAADFVGLIHDADLIVTDSYHGAIFSFLFDRPLVMLERHGFAGAMNTRIRTLAKTLALAGRVMSALPVEDAGQHDYSSGRLLLSKKRAEYEAYLDRRGLVRLEPISEDCECR